jgi:hypothetical protein
MIYSKIRKISYKFNYIIIKNFLNILFLVTVFGINNLYSQDTGKTIRDSASIKIKNQKNIPIDTGFYIRSNDGQSYLQIYGSLRLNGAYDLNGLQSEPTFSTFDIVTGNEKIDNRFFMAPYQTRFGINAKLMTTLGIFNLKLETDFFGEGNAFRIRHAYGAGYNFLIGQTWSVFGDPKSIPITVDPDGPNSSVNERTIQLRYQPFNEKYIWAIAIESPRPDIATTDSTQPELAFQSFPDITSMISIAGGWGHVRFSGVLRSITVKNSDESQSVLAGYGGLISSKFDLSKTYRIYFQFTGGKGISRYIRGLTGKGQDVAYDEQNKTNELLPAFGGYICGWHEWLKMFSTSVTLGLLRILNKDFQPQSSFKASYYFSFNTFFSFIRPGRIGIEYNYGRRIDKDGGTGTANRVSFIGIVDF